MGAMILTISWIFFHAGASLTLATQANINSPAHIALTTILSSSCAGCLIFVGRPILNFLGKEEGSAFDPVIIINCQIAGIVAISASCSRVEHYNSCIIGVVASFLFMTSRVIL
jgi:Amt family ammonium transporter